MQATQAVLASVRQQALGGKIHAGPPGCARALSRAVDEREPYASARARLRSATSAVRSVQASSTRITSNSSGGTVWAANAR